MTFDLARIGTIRAAARKRTPVRESDVQRAVLDYVHAVAPEVFIYAIPNASRRTAGGRAGNAVPGLTVGIPDLGLVLPGGRAAFIEVKTPKGRLSAPQLAMGGVLVSHGADYAVVIGIDDVRAALAAWGVRTRESAQ